MGQRYHVGTSGWQYDHWRTRFYPKGLPKKDWFPYYSGIFSCVELNNSFYQQPKNETWDHWHDVAPPGFRFAVKANRYLTHMKRFKDSEEPLQRFLAGAERLKSYLGPLLYQTPPNFECDERNLERLSGFLKLLPRRHRHVFEFRHESWFDDEGLSLLREHNVALCVQDMPGLKCPVTVTASHAYMRLHGRDQPYAGRYSDRDLEKWADAIRGLDVDEVWVFFNNDLEGNAVDNARTLLAILGNDGET